MFNTKPFLSYIARAILLSVARCCSQEEHVSAVNLKLKRKAKIDVYTLFK